MNRTYTPQLAPAVLDRLATYAGRFRRHFKHSKQAVHCSAYLQGLLLDGERKSIEPMSRRVHTSPMANAPPTPTRPCNSSLGKAPGMTPLS